MDDDQLQRLSCLGEYVKAKLEHERLLALFAPKKVAEEIIRGGRQGDVKEELRIIGVAAGGLAARARLAGLAHAAVDRDVRGDAVVP